MTFRIFGDWGTTSCRLFLYDGEREIERLAEGKAPKGVMHYNDVAHAFLEAVAKWRKDYAVQYALLSGMVGSNMGWKLTQFPNGVPYIDATKNAVGRAEIQNGLHNIQIRDALGEMNVRIVPGVKTHRNSIGQNDVMRGEETQILGWMADSQQEATLCLPGTHSKWVSIKNQGINNFATVMTGELFGLWRQHGSVITEREAEIDLGQGFKQGVELAQKLDLQSLIFTVRSNQIIGDLPNEKANSYLLGLLIGAEIKQMYQAGQALHIIGSTRINASYKAALDILNIKTHVHDGEECALRGLQLLVN